MALRSDDIFLLGTATHVSVSQRILSHLYDKHWLPRKIVDLAVNLAMKDGFHTSDSPSSEDPAKKSPDPKIKVDAAQVPVVVKKPAPGAAALVKPGAVPGIPEPEKPDAKEDELYQLFLERTFSAEYPDGLFHRGAKWGRLFGGGALLLGAASEPTTELTVGTDIVWLDVVTRYDLTVLTFDEDRNSPRYRQPLIWRLAADHPRGPLDVHYTRLIRFPGIPQATRPSDPNERVWTLSVLQPLLESIFRYDDGVQGISNALGRFDVGVLTSPALFDALADLNQDEIDSRIKIFNDGIKNQRTVMLGKDELYTRPTLSFAGIPEGFKMIQDDICAGSDYPATTLFGSSPDGMNATGEGDRSTLEDMVKSYQTNVLTPALNTLMSFLSGSEVKVTFDPKPVAPEPGATDPGQPAITPSKPPLK